MQQQFPDLKQQKQNLPELSCQHGLFTIIFSSLCVGVNFICQSQGKKLLLKAKSQSFPDMP